MAVDNIIPLNDNNYDAAVHSDGFSGIVDFHAPWCHPCQKIKPVLVDLARANPGVTIYTVNADDAPNAALSEGVMALPTILAVSDGWTIARLQGNISPKKLAGLVEQFTEGAA